MVPVLDTTATLLWLLFSILASMASMLDSSSVWPCALMHPCYRKSMLKGTVDGNADLWKDTYTSRMGEAFVQLLKYSRCWPFHCTSHLKIEISKAFPKFSIHKYWVAHALWELLIYNLEMNRVLGYTAKPEHLDLRPYFILSSLFLLLIQKMLLLLQMLIATFSMWN